MSPQEKRLRLRLIEVLRELRYLRKQARYSHSWKVPRRTYRMSVLEDRAAALKGHLDLCLVRRTEVESS